MRLLDLFCGAGGAGEGYRRAGFDVTGVDNTPHPTNPSPVTVADAMHVLRYGHLDDYDVIHASPPCQAMTTMSAKHRGKGGVADSHDNLIPEVLDLLRAWGGVYVVENVPGARAWMPGAIKMSGGAFGLRVERPRLFLSNVTITPPPYMRTVDPIGVYGKHHDGRLLWRRRDGSEQRAARTLEQAQAAMGIDWMDWRDLAEAIPPAYTEHIGRQLIRQVAAA